MFDRSLFLSSLLLNTVQLGFAVTITIGLSTVALARPTGLGVFSIPDSTGKGTYTTASGSKGTYTIKGDAINGYNGKSFSAGNNGLQIVNNESYGDTTKDKDKFEYTITLTPENPNEIHNILIAQAGYATSGNSEIAKQTLSYMKSSNNALSSRASIISNPSVAYFYNAMGDYFMGTKNSDGSLRSGAEGNNPKSSPQLRLYTADAERLKPLYYYNILSLEGSGSVTSYKPTVSGKKSVVSFKPNSVGVLPVDPTINKIIKELSDSASYPPLTVGSEIANGSTYVSFGIENTVSEYVVKVDNAQSVTLTYEGVMNGNIGVRGNVFGETYNEWITFGVSSEPTYRFSGVVFNDNGSITNEDANNAESPYKENTKYFNGVLDEGEIGITGSTIQLINCADTGKVYSQKDTDASGNYSFTIAQSLLPKDKVCIKESSTPISHPIATSPSLKTISISTGTTNYTGNNFGHVTTNNAPLVLEKLQFANKCNLASLLESTQNGVVYSKEPVNASNSNVAPMNCIAYKLVATNRANLTIKDVVIQDVLAKKGSDSLITSALINNDKRVSTSTKPESPAVKFNDTLKDGENGTVKTAVFSLAAKEARSFYFNTKYGSTQSP